MTNYEFLEKKVSELKQQFSERRCRRENVQFLLDYDKGYINALNEAIEDLCSMLAHTEKK